MISSQVKAWLFASTMSSAVMVSIDAFVTPPSASVTPHRSIPTIIPWTSSSSSSPNSSSRSAAATDARTNNNESFRDAVQQQNKNNVDMNQYNLPVDQIAEEWTAQVVPQSSLREEGIYLSAKSSKEIMVDTVKVSLQRQVGQGLGVELLEMAGGRDDGLGITVINGVVEGGAADGKDVMVGDSIVAVSVVKTERSSEDGGRTTDIETSLAIDTECFGYDKTVEAIGSLPPPESDNMEFLVLTLKRLRRKPKVIVQLQYPPYENEPDTTIELFAGENLRRAMLTRGVKLNDKLSARFDSGGMGDCGAEGTCATCVVGIVKGDNLVSPQGTQEAQILKKNPRWRMACKATVGYGLQEGEMTIRVNPRQWN